MKDTTIRSLLFVIGLVLIFAGVGFFYYLQKPRETLPRFPGTMQIAPPAARMPNDRIKDWRVLDMGEGEERYIYKRSVVVLLSNSTTYVNIEAYTYRAYENDDLVKINVKDGAYIIIIPKGNEVSWVRSSSMPTNGTYMPVAKITQEQ